MTPTAGPTGDGPWPPVAPGDSAPKVKVDMLETTDEQGGLGIVEESTRQQRAGSSRADLPHSQELTLQCACDLWDGDIVVERTFVHFPNPSSERATSDVVATLRALSRATSCSSGFEAQRLYHHDPSCAGTSVCNASQYLTLLNNSSQIPFTDMMGILSALVTG